MNNRNSSGSFLPFAAIFILAISFGMKWFTIRGAYTAYSINGSVSLGLFDLPIWLVIVLGIFGTLLTIPKIQQATSAPKGVAIGMLGVVILSSMTIIAMAIVTPKFQINTGTLLALAGGAMGLLHATRPRGRVRRKKHRKARIGGDENHDNRPLQE